MQYDSLFEELRNDLPKYLTRKDIGSHLGNIISPHYLANLDSLGKGPQRTSMKGKTIYLREDFIDWLKSRVLEDNRRRIAQ